MSPKKISQLSLNAGFMSSILHLLPLIYPIFTYLDPDQYRYSEYGYGSTFQKGPEYGFNLNPVPDPQH